ncbi:cell division protein anillin domain-containing protein [Ditylenchus destructor]|uniref:Cell division protein anillin domain-containing protein n=1 Tax=Ditylenchus destructor TaxID=166010 RepID=A0AAD4N146_9BILA|nr:cell division protein anillin domain-containing protein [Ditylenchus destructor]
MEHEHKKGHKKGGRKKKHKHGNWSDEENKAADVTENNTEPVPISEGGAFEDGSERRNSEVPADNQENSADRVAISDETAEENAFEDGSERRNSEVPADNQENSADRVAISDEAAEENAFEDGSERRNSEVPADNQENSADRVAISDEAAEENAFEDGSERRNSEVPPDNQENSADRVAISDEAAEENAFEDGSERRNSEVPPYNQENSADRVAISDEAAEENAFEDGSERRNSEVPPDNQENSADRVAISDEAAEENAFEDGSERRKSEVPEDNQAARCGKKKGGRKKKHKHGNWSDEENKAADVTENNTEPVPISEGGAFEDGSERRNSEVPADNQENSADRVAISDEAAEENAFEDGSERRNSEVPADNQENSADRVAISDEAAEENAFENGSERRNSEVPPDNQGNGTDPVPCEDENEQTYFELPVYKKDSTGRSESPNVSGISKKSEFNLKHSRSWDDNKLTEVRSALRQRGDIRRLVSQFESLAEEKTLEPTIVMKGNSPAKFNASKNFSYIMPAFEQKGDVYGRSPPDYPTAGSSSSKVIDQMFAFVKSDDMQTPKSTLAIRPAASTPRRPLATSTPLFSSHSADRPLASGDCSGNDEQLYREKCQSLVREIAIQQQQASQAAEGIVICQKKHSFNGTIEELNAQRSLLVANERRLLLNQELDKLRERHALKKASSQKGWVKMPEIEMKGNCTVEITSIKVNLNRSYYIKSQDTDISFVFLALCKCGEQLYATQVQHCLDMGTMRSNAVQFRESMRFEHLPVDFALILEIYAFKIMSRDNSHGYSGVASKLASKAKAFMGSKKAVGNIFNNSEAGGFQAHSDFYRCGILRLNRDSVGKHHFCDNGAQYPLEGTLEVRASYVFAAM